jgi:hypothetical protein
MKVRCLYLAVVACAVMVSGSDIEQTLSSLTRC